jgi:hypothetical protein
MRRIVCASLLAATWIAILSGCASQPHVRSDAALGKVIIYRNGVAYFERQARFEGDKLALGVPADRIDDFLKSLTVVNADTGQALPVSFPAANKRQGDTVELSIQLPSWGQQNLRLSYVTESPAWKPTYRVILGDSGRARLQAWAVVDNVSGEDWKKVTVGVGSTSALSFKFDLHSVRLVERETLATDSTVALAPPTGGSPYAVGGKEIKVLGNIRADDVDNLARNQALNQGQRSAGLDAAPDAEQKTWRSGHGRAAAASPTASASPVSREADKPKDVAKRGMGNATTTQNALGGLDPYVQALRTGNSRVRIEGFAQQGDSSPAEASLNRANVVRDQLIASGVAAERIDAVGTARLSQQDGVRIVMADEQPKPAQATSQAGTSAAKEPEPLGSALFVGTVPLTIEDGRSAMVSLVNADTDARQVYYFDPVSARGSNRYAFKAVRLVNPSAYTLDSGPFTVYASGQFLGEGLSEPIPPKSVTFIPFALDRQLVVDSGVTTREEISKLITIQRGIVSTECQRIRQTKLTLVNRGDAPAEVYVRHAVAEGWALKGGGAKYEKLGGAFLFPVTAPAKGSLELVIEESTPIMKTVDIRTDHGVEAIGLYLRTAQLDASLQGKLNDIVRLHKEIHDNQEKVNTLESQMQVYRTRLDEIHVQLVTLRQVPTAQQLSRHLAQKMEEISNRLQKATMEVTDLKGQLMASQIAIQDRLAELTLSTEKNAKQGTSTNSGAP